MFQTKRFKQLITASIPLIIVGGLAGCSTGNNTTGNPSTHIFNNTVTTNTVSAQSVTNTANSVGKKTATTNSTTRTLTLTAKHQTYTLTVSKEDDAKSFHYTVVQNGIVWVSPLPLESQMPEIHKGKYWSIYFTPFQNAQHQPINLKQSAQLQVQLPVRENTFYNSISKFRATGNNVFIEVIQSQKSAQPSYEAYYLNENVQNPHLAQLVPSYEYSAGGIFGETLLSDGYFILVQEMPKNSGAWDAMSVRVRAFHFSNHKWFTMPSDINAKHDYKLPTLSIKNDRLYYHYSNSDDISVKLPS